MKIGHLKAVSMPGLLLLSDFQIDPVLIKKMRYLDIFLVRRTDEDWCAIHAQATDTSEDRILKFRQKRIKWGKDDSIIYIWTIYKIYKRFDSIRKNKSQPGS